MQTLVPLLIGFILLLGALIILPLRERYKLNKRIRTAFGRPPQVHRGLPTARPYYASLAGADPHPAAVDDLTWYDLDLDEVYNQMNACQSTVGDVYLYAGLRRPAVQREAAEAMLSRRTALLDFYDERPVLRHKVQYRLCRLGRGDGSGLEIAVFHPEVLSLRFRWLYPLMALLPWVSLLLLFVNLPLGILTPVGALIANINLSSWVKNKNDSNFRAVRFWASSLACARRLAGLLQHDAPEEAARLRAAAGAFRAGRVSIAILSASEVAEQNLGFDPLGFFMLPMLCYMRVAGVLRRGGAKTRALYEALGEVDAAISLLSWRHTLAETCAPQFLPEAEIEFTDLVHPLLDEAVPNSAHFTGGVLLTGSNASGKSTFIKSVALGCLLAQSAGIVPAARFALHCGRIATSMAVEDSIVDGDSYFVAEIKSMRRLIKMAEGELFCWFFIDEILKGTNTVERVAAAASVLQALSSAHCIPFAASHDIELTSLLSGLYENAHFRETVAAGGVFFDYQLRSGPSTTRNALVLLEKMGFPGGVVDTARQLAAHFEESGEWGTLPPA